MKCQLEHATIHYETRGEGRPLVALHGFSPDHRLMMGCLEPVFRRREGWKRIYPDLPGMGKTPGEEWIDNSDRMLTVIMKFIEKVIPNQRFVLAGESYGGYLARAVAQKKHDMIDGLLLICPLIVADRTKRKLPKPEVLLQDLEFLSTLDEKDAIAFKEGHVVLTRQVWRRFRKEVLSGLRIADNDFLGRITEHGYAFSSDLEAHPEIFDKPCLLVAGRQDSSVGYVDAWSIVQKYPRMTFAVLDRAGHDLQIEQETVFAALVNEWIGRIQQFQA